MKDHGDDTEFEMFRAPRRDYFDRLREQEEIDNADRWDLILHWTKGVILGGIFAGAVIIAYNLWVV